MMKVEDIDQDILHEAKAYATEMNPESHDEFEWMVANFILAIEWGLKE